MLDETHQNQAHNDQSDARAQRDSLAERAHQDADAALLQATKDANPFNFKNVMISIGVLFLCWSANEIWSGQQEHNKTLQDSMGTISSQISDIHDAVLVHSIDITNLKVDVQALKSDWMTKEKVDQRVTEELRALRRAEQKNASDANVGALPPVVGSVQPKEGSQYYQ